MNYTTWVKHVADEPLISDAATQRARQPRPAGRRLQVGLLDNSKDNARRLLDMIGERVLQSFDAGILRERKYTSALGADDAVIERLARDTDCVITAMAD